MKSSEKAILGVLRQSTLAYLSDVEFAGIEKAIERNGILNLTGVPRLVLVSAVQKHAQHDQSTHGNWANTGEGDFDELEHYDKLNSAYQKKYKNIKEDEIYGLETYIETGGLEMNASLRKGNKEKGNKDLQLAIDVLDKTIEEAPVLFGDKNLYRVYSDKVLAKMQEGDLVTDKGYLSTTKINLIDDESTRDQLSEISETKDTVAVILPNKNKNGKGFSVETWADVAGRATEITDSEQEILLPRSTPLKFLGYTKEDVPREEGKAKKIKVAIFQRMD